MTTTKGADMKATKTIDLREVATETNDVTAGVVARCADLRDGDTVDLIGSTGEVFETDFVRETKTGRALVGVWGWTPLDETLTSRDGMAAYRTRDTWKAARKVKLVV